MRWRKDLPIIFDSQEVPGSKAEIGACVISSVNEMRQQFLGFLNRYSKVLLPWPPGDPISDKSQPTPTQDGHCSLPYFIVVKNPQPINTPKEQKPIFSIMWEEDQSVNYVEL